MSRRSVPSELPVRHDRYNIAEQLARGGMGVVYHAFDRCTLRFVQEFEMRRSLRLLTAVAESDRTFELREVRGRRAWVGPCSHCKKAIVVPTDDREAASATLEHIVPRTHGGGDELENLALACASCNHEKGRKLDWRRLDDPALQRVIERQLRERLARLRRGAT